MQRKLTWKKEPVDVRDFRLSLSIPKYLPGYSYLTKFAPSVEDQGNLGSCVGHGVTEYYELLRKHHKLPDMQFSRLYVYYNARIPIDCTNEDSGCYIRDAIKMLAKYGACEESLWPYIESKVFTKPPQKCYDAAEKFQALRYERINTLLELKAAIAEHRHPVVFGFNVYESFWNIGADGIMPMPNTRLEELQGGHCVLAIGYNDKARLVRCRNSWGRDWGCFGDFFMPYDFFESEECDDRWVILKGEQV